MKRSSLVLVVLVLATVGASLIGADAAPSCTPPNPTTADRDRTANDQFGSCETKSGKVKCGDGTDVPGLFRIIVDPNKGVQGCSSDDTHPDFPISGRVTVYKDPATNKVTVASDGGDEKNPGGAGGWTRADVEASGRACVRRGSGGTYWTRNGGTSTPDSPFPVCVPS
jgi:hypothetical protein